MRWWARASPESNRVLGNFKLRVLVAWVCRGPTALQLFERVGENVIVTQTRVRIPLGGTSEMGRSMTATLSDPEIQPDIQHRRRMGERTHRNHVDTRGGDFPDCREVDSS
jgi:hypothetical protein